MRWVRGHRPEIVRRGSREVHFVHRIGTPARELLLSLVEQWNQFASTAYLCFSQLLFVLPSLSRKRLRRKSSRSFVQWFNRVESRRETSLKSVELNGNSTENNVRFKVLVIFVGNMNFCWNFSRTFIIGA